MNAKEELLFDKDDMNSLHEDPVSPSSDQLEQDFNDVMGNNGVQLTAKRKLVSPEGHEDPEVVAMSPSKQLHLAAQHHNNNDVSFVLIDDDGGGGTGPDDLASGDEEVSDVW